MQRHPDLAVPAGATPVRAAMLDLVSRAEAPSASGLFVEESNLIAALQQIVSQGRQPADQLFSAYHGDIRGKLARVFAEFGD